MATDIRTKFQNNRRRETSAVTVSFPAVIEPAELRTATAAVVAASGTYTGVTLPAGTIVKGISLVVDEAFDSATSATLAATIGGTSVLAATNVKVLGLTTSTTNLPMLLTSNADLVGTFAIVGAPTKGCAKIVVDYISYDGATLSYIGEV